MRWVTSRKLAGPVVTATELRMDAVPPKVVKISLISTKAQPIHGSSKDILPANSHRSPLND
jgi:hypothetical protein